MKFFEALDIIAKKAEISLNFTTEDGSIGIMPGGPELPNQVGRRPGRGGSEGDLLGAVPDRF